MTDEYEIEQVARAISEARFPGSNFTGKGPTRMATWMFFREDARIAIETLDTLRGTGRDIAP